ncbi:NAD-binding protein [Flavobacterium sp. 3HN19-14]|uniref:NAD-binding protein n=1 Tax=Flavobacterium sp. 3HN19-14 TaxID=3448133 RepID=UPI003EE2B312
MEANKKILISGASFAGLATAYRMYKMGYEVTIVEMAPELKKGGTPVDIKGTTIEIVKRMGLFEILKSLRIGY